MAMQVILSALFSLLEENTGPEEWICCFYIYSAPFVLCKAHLQKKSDKGTNM